MSLVSLIVVLARLVDRVVRIIVLGSMEWANKMFVILLRNNTSDRSEKGDGGIVTTTAQGARCHYEEAVAISLPFSPLCKLAYDMTQTLSSERLPRSLGAGRSGISWTHTSVGRDGFGRARKAYTGVPMTPANAIETTPHCQEPTLVWPVSVVDEISGGARVVFSPSRGGNRAREKVVVGTAPRWRCELFSCPLYFLFSFLASLIFLKGFCKDGGTTNVFFCLFHLFLFVSRKYAL